MSKGELTRTRILDEALVLASRMGLEGLTLGVLAENLGLSKSGLYAHFRSKEALVLAVIDYTKARHLAHVAPYLEGKTGLALLRAYFEGWLDWTALPSLPAGCPLLGASFEFEDLEGQARDALVKMTMNSRAYLSRLLKQAVDTQELTADLPIEQCLFEMRGITLSFHVESRLLKEPRARERADRAFAALIARYSAAEPGVKTRK